MRRQLAVLLTLLAGPVWAQVSNPSRIQLREEGAAQGSIFSLNCVGTELLCAATGGTGTITFTPGSPSAFDDAAPVVKGSADPSKLLRFEVDGFAAATTRVLTAQNKDGTIATLAAGTETHSGERLFQGGVQIQSNTGLSWGSDAGTSVNKIQRWSGTNTPTILAVGSASRAWIVAETADITFDWAHAIPTNPTVYIHSSVQSATQFLALSHDQTDGVIAVGTGGLKVPSVVDFASGSGGTLKNSTGGASVVFENTGKLQLNSSIVLNQLQVSLRGMQIGSATGWAPSCSFTSGGGTSPSCAMDSNSANNAGIINMTTGSGSPGATGTVTLSFTGSWGSNTTVCVVTLMDGAGAWNGAAAVKLSSASQSSAVIAWSNNAVGLTASTAYKITYVCIGK